MSKIGPFKTPEKVFTEWEKVGNRHIQHVYYLYKDGTAITKAERIDLIDIKFKRALKKNDEYVCKSI